MTQAIESICGTPIGENEPPSWFKVGEPFNKFLCWDSNVKPANPIYRTVIVTKIELREENRGDHGIGWYDVWAGDVKIASLNERAVAEIYWVLP